MLRFESPTEAAGWCRADAGTLGFVPTMGALHEGHLELVRRAARENDRVCVSIFVNPLQFDDPQDLARYPRDFEGDVGLLAASGASAVFTGTLEEFFPETDGAPALLDPGEAARGLEGDHRVDHFAGVVTIVDRLFDLVRPTRAYFGEKDFQQTLVVRALAARRGDPEIVVGATVREPGGLARSSRNTRLSSEGRERARVLSLALAAAQHAWAGGQRSPLALVRVLEEQLAERPAVEVEYAEVRDPERWTAERPARPLERAQALVAARVEGVRLIDNLRLDAPLPAELEEAAEEADEASST